MLAQMVRIWCLGTMWFKLAKGLFLREVLSAKIIMIMRREIYEVEINQISVIMIFNYTNVVQVTMLCVSWTALVEQKMMMERGGFVVTFVRLGNTLAALGFLIVKKCHTFFSVAGVSKRLSCYLMPFHK